MRPLPSEKYLCPVHGKPLKKKRVLYGLITGEGSRNLPKDVIIGGCIEREDRKFGYECSLDGKVYFIDEKGQLVPQYEEN